MSQWEHVQPVRPAKRRAALKVAGVAGVVLVAAFVSIGVANHLTGARSEQAEAARLQALDWRPLPSLSGAGVLGPFELEPDQGRQDDKALVRQDGSGLAIETLANDALHLSARKVAEEAPVRRIRASVQVERLTSGAYVGLSFAQEVDSNAIRMVLLDAEGGISPATLSVGASGADLALQGQMAKAAAPAGRTIDIDIIDSGAETTVFVGGRWAGATTTVGPTLRALPGLFVRGEGAVRLVSLTVETPAGAPSAPMPPVGAPQDGLDPAAWRN